MRREPPCAMLILMPICETCGAPCKRRWCSQACNAVSRKAGRDATCEWCRTTFYLRPTYEEKGGGRFCSVPCRRAHKSANAVNYPKVGKKAIHRIVMAKKLGRPLQDGEVVHHKNGDKKDYSEDNLDVFPSQSDHIKHEAANGAVGFTHEQAVEAGRLSGESRRRHSAASAKSSV